MSVKRWVNRVKFIMNGGELFYWGVEPDKIPRYQAWFERMLAVWDEVGHSTFEYRQVGKPILNSRLVQVTRQAAVEDGLLPWVLQVMFLQFLNTNKVEKEDPLLGRSWAERVLKGHHHLLGYYPEPSLIVEDVHIDKK